ncbi:hypothetical protein NAU58_18690 [Pseudomonas stutzeri]|uniref:Uncharacterized protein n=1 Tax=Stutzerimonas stutzeri TaxID=316 RepID=A0A2N8S673_STUST|nr:hypothetical protein [Stutzerimonas stutzeri]MCQ4297608.1 hypothetical protein [Stutzerimonas stutzeri]PNF82109.1 hypothetical protein CXK92_01155 [Stutzerimonas stutzeri]
MTRSCTLPRRIAVTLLTLSALCAALLLGVNYWATPTVVIRNQSGVTVQVEAQWSANRKKLPAIAPGAMRTFKVAGESSIAFVVTYPDGRQLTSLPMYFTTFTAVTAVVTDGLVDVRAKF